MKTTSIMLALVLFLVGWTFAHAVDAAERTVRIGFVDPVSLSRRPYVDAFWTRLGELGWVEGRNVVVEARSAEGHYDRLPLLMQEVIDRKIDILVTYSTAAGIAAKKATSTVPIVDASLGDPVRDGLAASLARPGGNLTGLSFGWTEGFAGKFLELLQEAVPQLSVISMVMNPNNPFERAEAKELMSASAERRLKLIVIPLRDTASLQQVLQQARQQAQAMLVLGDPLLHAHRHEITLFANSHRLPALYGMRDFVDAGGMMAYGPDVTATWRRAAEYVDKVLRGTRPGELPIEQPTRYSLIVNAKAAKAIGITIPESILLRADEVIR